MTLIRKIVPRTPKTDKTLPYLPEWLQRVYQNRDVVDESALECRLNTLHSPNQLGGMEKAVEIVIDAIQNQRFITIAGDYDCDGATGTTVLYRGLKLLGAQHVSYVLPDRFKDGYGLSPTLVERMVYGSDTCRPDLIITVDSGVSSIEGVALAKSLGIQVVVTDHHLPGDTLPDADAIVNPNLEGDPFPSKALAGVGVGFYLLLAAKSRMEALGLTVEGDLRTLLDVVALGTVADLVPLDANNRTLIRAGLRRLRNGGGNPGIRALLELGGKNPNHASCMDFGFVVGPRLNAAGRLENMGLGVECLTTDSADHAEQSARTLDEINNDRKILQAEMLEVAEKEAEKLSGFETQLDGVVIYRPDWHSGIVGLVASRLKDSLYRPVFALAPATPDEPNEYRGSGRSIPGIHLRDVLAEIDAESPGIFMKYGGHAMAAGLSIQQNRIPEFQSRFDEVVKRHMSPELKESVVYTDGELPPGEITLASARLIHDHEPWGQGFPLPTFEGVFNVLQWRVLRNNHLKLLLEDPRDRSTIEGIFFRADSFIPPPLSVRIAYELQINVWNQFESLQLVIHAMEPI